MQSPSATLQRHTAQQSEYRAMITALRAVLGASTSLQTYYLAPQAHSRLGAAHAQAQNLLHALFEGSAEPQLAAYLQTSRGSLLQVDAAAGHCSFSFDRPDGSCARYAIEDVTRASNTFHEFQRALLSIGAHLRSDRLLPLSQLLRESGFTFADVQDATALARLIGKHGVKLIAIGNGNHPASWMTEVLHARSRDAAAPTFSPDGLYFLGPRYDARWGLPERTALFDGLP